MHYYFNKSSFVDWPTEPELCVDLQSQSEVFFHKEVQCLSNLIWTGLFNKMTYLPVFTTCNAFI